MKKEKQQCVYVSIPITGRDIEVVQADLAKVKAELEGQNFQVITPLDMEGWKPSQSWEWYMVRCLHMMDGVQAIYMCEGWKASAGCRLELEYAQMHGVRILDCNSFSSIL